VLSAVWGKVPFLPSVCQWHGDQVFLSRFDGINVLVRLFDDSPGQPIVY